MENQLTLVSTKKLTTEQNRLLDRRVTLIDHDFITIRLNRLKKDILLKISENVVITSKSALQSLLLNFSRKELNIKNIYCVGKRTKNSIEKEIGKVTFVGKSAKLLAIYIAEKTAIKEVTFFCGNLKREELTNILSKNNITVNEIEAYRTMLTPKEIETDVIGALFFSPSGVQSYLLRNSPNTTVAYCIGDTTAKEAKLHFKNVQVAANQDIESVINLANLKMNYEQN